MASRNSAPVPDPRGAGGSEALQKLKRGEITLAAYLDLLVERNVQHIIPLVSEEQLAEIKELMREALRTSPGLIEAVRDATGITEGDGVSEDELP